MLFSNLRFYILTCHQVRHRRRRHLRYLITLAGVHGQSRSSPSYASSSYCWATTEYWNDGVVSFMDCFAVDLLSNSMKTLTILLRKCMSMDWRLRRFVCYLYHSSKRTKKPNQRQASIQNALFVWANSKKANWLKTYLIAIIRFIVLASTPGSVTIRVALSADCTSRISQSIVLLLILLQQCWRRSVGKTLTEKEYRIIKHFVLKFFRIQIWEEMLRFKDQINETDEPQRFAIRFEAFDKGNSIDGRQHFRCSIENDDFPFEIMIPTHPMKLCLWATPSVKL